MLRIGLTGGIGSGKSTVSGVLRHLGAVVIDADLLAREVVAAGTPGLAQVVDRFGVEVLAATGELDRPALGAIVFADATARRDLEAITHPRIEARTAELFDAAARDGAGVVVHDMPLLVEKGLGPTYHLVVVVDAPEDLRLERLVADRGMSADQVRARMAAQATESARRAAADVWLSNDGSRADVEARARQLWWTRLVPYAQNVRLERAAAVAGPMPVTANPEWSAQARRLADRLSRAMNGAVVEYVGGTTAGGPASDLIELEVGLPTAAAVEDPEVARRLGYAGFFREGTGDGSVSPLPDGKLRFASADPGRPAVVTVRVASAPGWRGPHEIS